MSSKKSNNHYYKGWVLQIQSIKVYFNQGKQGIREQNMNRIISISKYNKLCWLLSTLYASTIETQELITTRFSLSAHITSISHQMMINK